MIKDLGTECRKKKSADAHSAATLSIEEKLKRTKRKDDEAVELANIGHRNRGFSGQNGLLARSLPPYDPTPQSNCEHVNKMTFNEL